MTINIGSTDRKLRVVAGMLLLLLPFVLNIALFENPIVKIGTLVVGLVLVVTGMFRFCPLYRLLGIQTCKI